MRLNQIRDFLEVVESGSLRAAAGKIGISQPAITKSIRQLEQELHAQLLHRNARGAAMTPAGQVFLERARVIQSELRKAQEQLALLRGGAEGSVAFGAAPITCMLVVPDAMLQFRRNRPGASVRIIEGVNRVLLPLVRDETLDFAISQNPNTKLDAGLRFKPLFRPKLNVVGRRGHPLGSAKSLRQLADASWLMFYPPGTGAMLETAFAGLGLPLPRAIVHCESYATALSLIAKTDILGLMSPQIASEGWGQRQLQKIEVEEEIPSPLVGLYTRADTPLTPTAASLVQAVTATARQLARRG
ncbi:MAG TPA: LysR substrate-binding domain-containing protein [Burkholderiales bacterium]|nr:LysR substrate-binding domain-containing protein [Burkholderiales bacterium]